MQAEVAHTSWWRALLARLRRREVHEAGARPAERRERAIRSGSGGRLRRVVGAAVGLAVLALIVLSNVGPERDPIRNRFISWKNDVVNLFHTTYNPVHPTAAAATSTAPGHPAQLAIDGVTNTSWQTGGPGTGQTLTLTLSGPTDLAKIGFDNGDNDTPQSYLTEARPHQLHVVFSGTSTTSKDLTLADSSSFQSFTVDAKGARTVAITIQSVYPAAQSQVAALAEVELFTKG